MKNCSWEDLIKICKLLKFSDRENQKCIWPHGSKPTEVFPTNLNSSFLCNFYIRLRQIKKMNF